MTAEVPAWQRVFVPFGFVVWLSSVPEAWVVYGSTTSEIDSFGTVFGCIKPIFNFRPLRGEVKS
jgi:hypothetical protein